MLPNFTYHPDPLFTGSIVESDVVCICCNQSRGYVYTGPTYAAAEIDNELCPWCIFDGSAHAEFDAEFVDRAGIGDYGSWDKVPSEVLEAVAFRTAGFSGWQQERWWTHCGDAAEFIGPVGSVEAQELGPGFLEEIRKEAGIADEASWQAYSAALHAKHGPTAYAFRCRHCGKLGGYSDCH